MPKQSKWLLVFIIFFAINGLAGLITNCMKVVVAMKTGEPVTLFLPLIPYSLACLYAAWSLFKGNNKAIQTMILLFALQVPMVFLSGKGYQLKSMAYAHFTIQYDQTGSNLHMGFHGGYHTPTLMIVNPSEPDGIAVDILALFLMGMLTKLRRREYETQWLASLPEEDREAMQHGPTPEPPRQILPHGPLATLGIVFFLGLTAIPLATVSVSEYKEASTAMYLEAYLEDFHEGDYNSMYLQMMQELRDQFSFEEFVKFHDHVKLYGSPTRFELKEESKNEEGDLTYNFAITSEKGEGLYDLSYRASRDVFQISYFKFNMYLKDDETAFAAYEKEVIAYMDKLVAIEDCGTLYKETSKALQRDAKEEDLCELWASVKHSYVNRTNPEFGKDQLNDYVLFVMRASSEVEDTKVAFAIIFTLEDGKWLLAGYKSEAVEEE